MDRDYYNITHTHKKESVDIVDLLICQPSKESFLKRVENLRLTNALEEKVHRASSFIKSEPPLQLQVEDEKELATEVLLLRHKFTELVWKTPRFNQAALTVLQNIYLFQNRKIFFDPCGSLYEQERQEALHLFSSYKELHSLPLSKTFQHLIIARVWSRIRSQSSQQDYQTTAMRQLVNIIESLNTVRNIYVLLTTGLVKKITSQIGDFYKEGISQEDAHQIGSFGISRAAYRYHHSSGVRFSTYASNWIKKEIQRQALEGRLIKISTNTIEQYSLAQKNNNMSKLDHYSTILTNSSCKYDEHFLTDVRQTFKQHDEISEQELLFESSENKARIHHILETHLSEREADVIKRRFGIAQYMNNPQSVISIAKTYAVTRSSIYQLESKALQVLRKALLKHETCSQ
ncbi:sigma-70 family RNA polymerase sigma factor [Desulforhopalus sp. 52FAK]